MLEQAADFLDESLALTDLIDPLPPAGFALVTGFKRWTVDDVLGHLHHLNDVAVLSLTDPAAFAAHAARMQENSKAGRSLVDFERKWLNGLTGRPLFEAWRTRVRQTAELFGRADPSARVKWFGPDMSVRSSITARLMETWAHGQEVYDALGVARTNTDRIRNIAVIGVNTYRWTFANRGEMVPQPAPHVRITAPSGAVWMFNDERSDELIEGSAEAFCQVVTQVRNVADTDLDVRGPNARAWMSKAQCFAGPPRDPPAPGTRATAATPPSLSLG
jgi:uncharacterized protein (TIGR03084 family)